MGSENPTGADNQQETKSSCNDVMLELDPNWVVGFVDGEGCFCVSLHRNQRFAGRSFGWQLQPTFQVYQHHRHRAVLEALISHFGCGKIRSKGPGSRVLTYTVDGIGELEEHILPYFERHTPLVKRSDFAAFAAIVRAIGRKEHYTRDGFERLVRLAYCMNAVGKQRSRSLQEILEGSSETARQAAPVLMNGPLKIQSELHGDMQSQTEMIWPTDEVIGE